MSPKFSNIPLVKLIRLVRFINLLILGLIQYLVYLFLLDLPFSIYEYPLHLIVGSTLFAAASGYIVNDYYDVKIDAINRPEKVVVGRAINRRYAMLWQSLLNFVAVLAAFWVSYKMAFLVSVSIYFLWFYSNHLKRKPFIGNFVIGLLAALTILLIPFHYKIISQSVVMYAFFSFAMTIIREIIKDMEDQKGDEKFGCKTLPIVWGIQKTKTIIYSCIALIQLSIIYFSIIHATFNPLLIATGISLFWLIFKLVRADTTEQFHQLSTLCKVIMLLGVGSMVFV
ncbi:MAG: geranylgeranylglycerol-phosphate geranylgeranyltransferase [Cyclobacteriaceae bacterium]